MRTTPARRDHVLIALLCAGFIALGWPFLRSMGIEVDEALAATGMYPRTEPHYAWQIAGHKVPVMLLSYLGALSAWMCAPLLALFGPGPLQIRLPSLLLGAGTVVVFWSLLRSASGRKAAWFGAVLLATDTSFLLLTAVDFGPVAAQLFLKTAAMWLLLEWRRSGRDVLLAVAWLLFGIALWDKAVFVWIAAGMLAGAVAAFPRELQRAITVRNTAIATLALCAGAAPLISYNIAHPLNTFRSNARIEPGAALAKTGILQKTLDGGALLGFFTAEDVPPRAGHVAVQLPRPPWNLTIWLFAAALLFIPWVWRTPARSPAIFGAVSFFAGWLAMALSAGAGGAAHHVVLLWPVHFLVIAAVLGQLRGSAWAIAAAVLMNLLVTAHYYQELIQHGPGVRWTRAVEPLTEELRHRRAEFIFIVDWGIFETVNLLARGELPLLFANEYTSPDTPPSREPLLREIMQRPQTFFITHTDAYEQMAGVNAALDAFAERAGLRKEVVSTVYDQFGRAVFLILQFH